MAGGSIANERKVSLSLSEVLGKIPVPNQWTPADEEVLDARKKGFGFQPYHSMNVPRRQSLKPQAADGAELGTPVTTLMLRNIPNKFTQSSLMAELDAFGFADTYSFFYLPMDQQNRSNVGYAFINFNTAYDAERFGVIFRNHRFQRHQSTKIGSVCVAHVQGLDENLRHFENRAVTHSRHDQYRPVVLQRKRRVAFEEAVAGAKLRASLSAQAARGAAPTDGTGASGARADCEQPPRQCGGAAQRLDPKGWGRILRGQELQPPGPYPAAGAPADGGGCFGAGGRNGGYAGSPVWDLEPNAGGRHDRDRTKRSAAGQSILPPGIVQSLSCDSCTSTTLSDAHPGYGQTNHKSSAGGDRSQGTRAVTNKIKPADATDDFGAAAVYRDAAAVPTPSLQASAAAVGLLAVSPAVSLDELLQSAAMRTALVDRMKAFQAGQGPTAPLKVGEVTAASFDEFVGLAAMQKAHERWGPPPAARSQREAMRSNVAVGNATCADWTIRDPLRCAP